MMQTDKCTNTFVIIVDRVEGKFAVCELPDDTICDIDISRFPGVVSDRERYEVRINPSGNIDVLRKYEAIIKSEERHKLPGRLIRF